MQAFEQILVDESNEIVKIVINRENKLNALSANVLSELTLAFNELTSSWPKTRVVILSGAGEKAFVAGADIAELRDLGTDEAEQLSRQGHRLGQVMEQAPFPIIASVQGFALGGGCELALCCDFIYASEQARFALPEVSLGLIPGFGGTQRLSARIGVAAARELIFTGRTIDAETARRLGLVNEVVPHSTLAARVGQAAEEIRSRAPLAVAAAKRAILGGRAEASQAGMDLEARAFAGLFASADAREGLAAFLERRKPSFKGV